MNDITTRDVIETFDRIVKYVWGSRREYENKKDEQTAQKWIDAGVDIVTISICCTQKFLHLESKGMRELPKSLNIIDDDIQNTRRRESGETLDTWECETSRWNARVSGFKKNGLWIVDQWGLPPTDKNCRAPKVVLTEHGFI